MGKRYRNEDFDEDNFTSKKIKTKKSNKLDKHRKKIFNLAVSPNSIREEEEDLYFEYSMNYKNRK